MPDRLRLTYRTDGDGTGEVVATASTLGWAGESSGWFGEGQLRQFAADLGKYPLDANTPPQLLTGYGPNGIGDTEFQPTIDIKVVAIRNRGQLGALIHLSSFVWPDDPAYLAGSAHMVLPTSYQRVGEFATAIGSLLDGVADEAILLGERFD